MFGSSKVKVVKISDKLQKLFPSVDGWKFDRKHREWISELGHAGWRVSIHGDYDGDDEGGSPELWYYPNNQVPIRVY